MTMLPLLHTLVAFDIDVGAVDFTFTVIVINKGVEKVLQGAASFILTQYVVVTVGVAVYTGLVEVTSALASFTAPEPNWYCAPFTTVAPEAVRLVFDPAQMVVVLLVAVRLVGADDAT